MDKYKDLENDVLQLKETVTIFHNLVNQQQESIDTIESFIQESKQNVTTSLPDLQTADKTQSSTTYLTVGVGFITSIFVYLLL